jgi:hypothetical protein
MCAAPVACGAGDVTSHSEKGGGETKEEERVRHYLVVANQTLGQPHLTDKILELAESGPCDFHVLVPATHAHEHTTWRPVEAVAIAKARLEAALARLAQLGVVAHGEVGDPSPMVAISSVLKHRSFDALVISTLPPGPSQWLRRGLPDRVQEVFHCPVVLVTATAAEASGAAR